MTAKNIIMSALIILASAWAMFGSYIVIYTSAPIFQKAIVLFLIIFIVTCIAIVYALMGGANDK